MKKLLYILLLTSACINAQQAYYGRHKDNYIHAMIFGDKAIIDYSWNSKSDGRLTILDTLEFRNGRYGTGKYSIKYEEGHYIFTRGQVVLSPQIFEDPSLYANRISGYRKTVQNLNKIRYVWMGDRNLEAILNQQDINILPVNTTPVDGYKIIDAETRIFNDSIKAFCDKFDSIKITDNRLFAKKKYLNTSDAVVISGIWNQLTASTVENRDIVWFYLAQGIALTVTLAAFNLEYIYLVAPGAVILSYGLYAIENMAAERFTAGKTYIISFLDNGTRILKVKVRNDYILGNMLYKFKLQEPFINNFR